MMMDFPTESTHCVVCGCAEGKVEARGRDYIYHGSEQLLGAMRCAGCGHVYLNPRPAPSALAVLYPSNYASFDGKFIRRRSPLSWLKERVMLARIDPLLERLPPGGGFLDVGCGDGQLLEAVRRRHPDVKVHGLDWKFSPDRRKTLEGLGIVLHESRLEQATLPAGQFHLVTLNQIIEHLWEPRACLATLHRALAPEGRLAIATPNVDGYDRHLFRDGTWGGYYFPRHLNVFSEHSIRRLLEDCGFVVEQARSLVAPVVWCYSLKAATQLRFPAAAWLQRLCDVGNVPLLALFAGIDLIAMSFGAKTSNQSVVARPKPPGFQAP